MFSEQNAIALKQKHCNAVYDTLGDQSTLTELLPDGLIAPE